MNTNHIRLSSAADPTGEPTSEPSGVPTGLPSSLPSAQPTSPPTTWLTQGYLTSAYVIDTHLGPAGVPTPYPSLNFGRVTFLNSRGTVTLVYGKPSQVVTVMASSFYGGAKKYLVTAVIDAPDLGMNLVQGQDIQILGDKVTGNMIFFDGVKNNKGYLHYYRGALAHWTYQQLLTVPANLVDTENDGDQYASSFKVDPFHLRSAIVGCYDCEITAENKGAVFLYDASDPKVAKWSQQQILYSNNRDRLGYPGVDIYDRTAISGVRSAISHIVSALVYMRAPNNIWSEQQLLFSNSNTSLDVSAISIYENSIFLGYEKYDVDDVWGYRNEAGKVEVLEPSTPRPKKPVQWSLHQTILANHPWRYEHYGSQLSTDGYNLAIASAGEQFNMYIYVKKNNYWTASAQFTVGTTPYPVDDLIVQGNLAVATTQEITTIYHNNTDWNCLYFSLGDQFGDGWSGAQLRIETPFGETDYFTQSCEVFNPLLFRYCPSYFTQSGVYRVSIEEAPKYPYHWEVYWKVYVESDGRWYAGDHTTQMDFIFDEIDRSFRIGAMRHLLINTTCTSCPPKPWDWDLKPKPQPKSYLRSNHFFPAADPPTSIPTFHQSYQEDWNYVKMFINPDSWFNEEHTGAYFYISDMGGKKLVRRETLCPPSPVDHCWVFLPDGKYVLRVGGALNPVSSPLGLEWSFCHTEGVGTTHLVFQVANNTCYPQYKYGSTRYCSKVLHAYGIVDIQLLFVGISVTTLNEDDLFAIKSGLAMVMRGIVDISVKEIQTQAYTEPKLTTVKVEVTIDLPQAGVDWSIDEAILEYISAVQTYATSHEGSIWNGIMSAEGRSTVFKSAKAMHFLSFRFYAVELDNKDLNFQLGRNDLFIYKPAEDSNILDLLPADANVNTQASSPTFTDNFLIAVSIYGYLVLFLSAGMFAFYQIRANDVQLNAHYDQVIDYSRDFLQNMQAFVRKIPYASSIESSIDVSTNLSFCVSTEDDDAKTSHSPPAGKQVVSIKSKQNPAKFDLLKDDDSSSSSDSDVEEIKTRSRGKVPDASQRSDRRITNNTARASLSAVNNSNRRNHVSRRSSKSSDLKS